MKIFGISKKIRLICAVFLLFLIAHFYCIHGMIQHYRLRKINMSLFLYTQLNKGEFPASMDCLLKDDLIKKDFETTNKYKIRYDADYSKLISKIQVEKLKWSSPILLAKYDIKYGTNTKHIEEKEGKLYDDEGKRFYFIKGPGFFVYRNLYNSASLDLYHAMGVRTNRDNHP